MSDVTLTKPIEVQIISNPGYGLPERNALFTVAGRLQKHYKGQISGRATNNGVTINTDKAWDKGDLSLDEAIYVAQYSLSRGLNPFGDIHIWWYKKLTVCEHWRIMIGWANLREKFSEHSFLIESPADRDKHGLADGDLGVVCFILKESSRPQWQMVYSTIIAAMLQTNKVDFDLAARKAYEATCPSAVGVVAVKEMTGDNGKIKQIDVKGWTWYQRAATRALRNAIGRSHGTPTPAEVMAYSQRLNPGLSLDALASPDFEPELTLEGQQRFFQLNRGQTNPQLGNLSGNVQLMRGGGDDAIGESDKERFARRVMNQIPFYTSESQVWMALGVAGLDFHPETEEMLFDELAKEANRQADKINA